MPLARVRIRLYGTAAQLTQAKSAILAEYPTAAAIFDRNDGTVTRIGSRFTLTTDIRLRSRTAGDALRDKAVGIVQNLRAIPVQGVVTYHQCTHQDQVVEPCIPERVVI